MKSLKIVVLIFLFLASLVFIFGPSVSAYNPFASPCSKNDAAKNSPACQQNAAQKASGSNPVLVTINHTVDLIAVLAGAAAVIVIIISGVMFVTSGGVAPGQRAGDPNRIKTARSALTGAVVGLVIIALAWTIITFVIDRIIQ